MTRVKFSMLIVVTLVLHMALGAPLIMENDSPHPRGKNVEAGLNKTGLSLTLSYFNKLGLNTLTRLIPGTASANSSQITLGLFEGGAGLNRCKYYLDEKLLGIYKSTMTKMLGLIMDAETDDGSTPEVMSNIMPETMLPSPWEDTAKQIVDFEKRLSETFTDFARLVNPGGASKSVFTTNEISALTPSIDWGLLLDDLLPPMSTGLIPFSWSLLHTYDA
ncbi:hypothetical protein BGZ67_010325 [Mortierella alpina]|nr:hypothetical protein BGZ67_010325 [Mortierella alpina]